MSGCVRPPWSFLSLFIPFRIKGNNNKIKTGFLFYSEKGENNNIIIWSLSWYFRLNQENIKDPFIRRQNVPFKIRAVQRQKNIQFYCDYLIVLLFDSRGNQEKRLYFAIRRPWRPEAGWISTSGVTGNLGDRAKKRAHRNRCFRSSLEYYDAYVWPM